MLKYALFLVIWQRRHGVWTRDKKTQGKVKGTSPGRKNYKSHGKSLSWLHGCCPCKGRHAWWEQGGGTMDNGAPKGRTPWFSPNPALCFLSRTETPLHPPTPLPHPSASCGCTQACLNELVITTLRKPDQPTAAGVGLPIWEVSLVDLLTEGDLEHPDGTRRQVPGEQISGLVSSL